ncbi:MAG TPA: thioesterase family protein [Anaeromyxobacteraceae bacterium]|nr:thioesterase family protein [Anaeromyxobacteraceae bacterium]
MTAIPTSISDYPLRAHDKLPYADGPLHEAGCSFVIASLHLDFQGEINWPGRVEVGTRVASVGRSSVTLEQALFQDGRCTATATTVIVQVDDGSRRSRPLGDAALRRLATLRGGP